MPSQISPCNTESTSYFVRYLSAKGTKKHLKEHYIPKLPPVGNGFVMRFLGFYRKLPKVKFDFRFPYGSPDANPPNGFTKPFGGFSISGKVHLIIV